LAGVLAAAPIGALLAMRAALDPHATSEALGVATLTTTQAVFWTAGFFPVHLMAPWFGAVFRLAPPMQPVFAIGSLVLVLAGTLLVARAGGRARPDPPLSL